MGKDGLSPAGFETVRMAASRTDYWSSASLRKSICCDPISALHRLAGTADLE